MRLGGWALKAGPDATTPLDVIRGPCCRITRFDPRQGVPIGAVRQCSTGSGGTATRRTRSSSARRQIVDQPRDQSRGSIERTSDGRPSRSGSRRRRPSAPVGLQSWSRMRQRCSVVIRGHCCAVAAPPRPRAMPFGAVRLWDQTIGLVPLVLAGLDPAIHVFEACIA